MFVGFGRGKLGVCEDLNAAVSAIFNNAALCALCDTSKNRGSVPGEQFCSGLVDAFSAWMKRWATQAGTGRPHRIRCDLVGHPSSAPGAGSPMEPAHPSVAVAGGVGR